MLVPALIASCVNYSGHEPSPVAYPESRYDSSDVKTTIGHDVADPYGWMEDDRSEETAEWVEAQNEVTFAHLEEIPFRAALRDRLSALWNYAKRGAPFIEGDYRYHYRNDGLQNQYVIYRVPVAGG
ncbi:MAG: S9 family peptidase, partial [Bacteroidetes bacterium]|nr:S9 family peptidase [Bacteroidota bacterium]